MSIKTIPGKIVRFIIRILKMVALLFYRLSTICMNKGQHVTRYYMYQQISKFNAPQKENLKVLSISESQYLAKLLGFKDNQITDISYPEYNILKLPFKDGEFDAIVSDQVLEHLEGNPQQAIDEMFRVLKPQGICLHTTCFIYPIHSCPNDFWRFTPEALKYLMQPHGEILEVNGWGNPLVWLYVGMGLQYQAIPHARWHPAHWLATKNNNSWPIVTWALVKKSN